jgi:N utilization substance protein B
VLFELDLNPMSTNEALQHAFGAFEGDLPMPEGAEDFAQTLVHGVVERREELDETIRSCSHNWRLERMAKVDLAVLRLAAYELRHCPEVPHRVVLNEAIELAKTFGSEDSGAFVNGLLDEIARQTQKDDGGTGEAGTGGAP